ncbi:hypothetical protein [Novosphingobium colocasiae]
MAIGFPRTARHFARMKYRLAKSIGTMPHGSASRRAGSTEIAASSRK